MIHVGLLGAGTPMSGELIRILAMHPDVELEAAQARGLEGSALTEVHHGLIGETDLKITSSIDYTKCDVIFIDAPTLPAAELTKLRLSRPDLKIIMLNAPSGFDPEKNGFVYGIPEINRKLLVRGATAATVPAPFASMALVALFPFASNLLLTGDVTIEISAPEAIIAESDAAEVNKEIETALRGVQLSFAGDIDIKVTPSDARRSTLMTLRFDCPLDLEQTLKLYDCYEDHRFSFVTTSKIGVSEVAGTNKCVVSVSKPDAGSVLLETAADCRLRGGAGEAVHIMNLMFGLHEKTGLNLKAIDFECR